MTDDRPPMRRAARTPRGSKGDGDEWMAKFTALDDHEIDALLDGVAPADDLSPIADLVLDLRARTSREPSPPMSAALRAQLAAPPIVASLPAHRMARSALVKAVATAAVATTVALVGVGASQNRLPSGIQDVVSSTAGLIGLDVPRSDEREADESEDPVTHDRGGQPTSGVGNGGEAGHGRVTPGGATPADPGTPGDKEPATPAEPAPGNGVAAGDPKPDKDNGGSNNASPTGQANGTGVAASNASPTGQANGTGVAGSNASPTGQANGTGVAGSNGKAAAHVSPNGETNGTGNAKKAG